jgi:uncharacterized phage protein gp47/JayE
VTYGVTDAGFARKPLDVILAEFAARQRSEIDPNWNTEADSLAGQMNGIFGDAIAQLWEQLEAVYASGDRGQAEGAALDAIGALTATPRRPATKGTVTLTLAVTAGSVVPAGSVVSVVGNPAARFVTLTDTPDTGGSFGVVAQAETAGRVPANVATLTVIETPVAGWTTATNNAAATAGEPIETDAEYRLRQFAELAIVGGSTLAGIKADLLRVPGVTSVGMLENVSDTTDGDGLPPHSFEAIVLGGAEAAIGESIWKNKPAGIPTHGLTPVTVTDSDGGSHDVNFTRPTEVSIYVAIEITTGDGYGTDEDLKDALELAAADPLSADGTDNPAFLDVGEDVYAGRLVCVAIEAEGVLNARVGLSLSAISDPDAGAPSIVIGPRQRATLVAADIVVTTV